MVRVIRSRENLENFITVSGIKVKVLSFRVRSDSLPAHTETNYQSEAGVRAESEPKQIGTLPLTREVLW
jgi:hypothetical protein